MLKGPSLLGALCLKLNIYFIEFRTHNLNRNSKTNLLPSQRVKNNDVQDVQVSAFVHDGAVLVKCRH